MNELQIFTDGACSSLRYGGWAALVDGELISGWWDQTTNNEMEMLAIYHALLWCPYGSRIHLTTDSKLALGWLVRRWNCVNPTIRGLIEAIRLVLDEHMLDVRYTLVKGHSFTAGNNRVDAEAVRQSMMCKRLTRSQRPSLQ